MARDSILEQQKCPRCWIGVLYNTGITSSRKPCHPYYQCCHCGRLITRDVFKKLMSGVIFLPPPELFRQPVSRERLETKRKMMERPLEEPGFIVGIVRDMETGKPVRNAYVFLKGMPLETFTNRYGQYSLEAVPPGMVILGIWEPDYRNIVKKIDDVTAGKIKAVSFRMQRLRKAAAEPELPKLIPPWGSELKRIKDWGVHGFVKDSEDRPLRAALVMLLVYNRVYITQTDSTGHYEILNIVPEGNYPIRANADGYTYMRKAVIVRKGHLTGCDFRLREA